MNLLSMTDRTVAVIKFWWWLVVVSLLVYLVVVDAVLSGQWSVEWQPDRADGALTKLVPLSRTTVSKDSQFLVTKEPVYLDVTAPRPFKKLTAKVTYRPTNDDLIEAGVKTAGSGFDVTRQPLSWPALDKLNWAKLSDGDLVLWQKQPLYRTIPEFLAGKDFKTAGFYNYPVPKEMIVDAVAPAKPVEINAAIRGPLTWYFYLPEEQDFNLTAVLHDLNRHDGPDPITAKLYRVGEKEAITANSLPDDGLESSTDPVSAARTWQLTAPTLRAGVYRLELKTTPDIFWKKFTSGTQYAVLADHLFLAGNAQYGNLGANLQATSLVTDGRWFVFQTPHEEGKQTVLVDDVAVAINNIQQPYRYQRPTTDGSLATVTAPNNDLEISTAGYLALPPAQWFLPLPVTLQWPSDLSRVQTILARYRQPITVGDSLAAQASFTLDDRYWQGRALRFVLSIPRQTTPLVLQRIELTFSDEGLTLTDWLGSLKRYLKTFKQ